MRVAVLVVGILGSLAAGGFGLIMWGAFATLEESVRAAAGVGAGEFAAAIPVEAGQQYEAQTALNAYFRARTGIWFVLAAFPLGLMGSFLAFNGRGISAGALILVAAVGPIVLMPGPLMVLCAGFNALLVLAGVMAFFARPAPPKREYDYDY